MVSGIVSICSHPAKISIDFSSTHSFVSHPSAKNLDKPLEFLDYELFIAVPLGAPLVSSGVFQGFEVRSQGKKLIVDLVPLIIQHFDVILGMD